MLTIEAKAIVTEDGKLTVQLPPNVTPGEHEVVVIINDQPIAKSTEPFEFPVHDVGPWPDGLSLRREDMYDEWGR